MRISVPLRTSALGLISPEHAAELTADIATEASVTVMHRKQTWLTADFCKAFKDQMNRLFFEKHRRLGARVSSP
jgi:hypothetical protein